MKQTLISLIFCGILTHCVSVRPYKDFAINETALKRAKRFSAHKVYPKKYLKAKSLYKKAQKLMREGSDDSARVYFHKSIRLVEDIELKSRYKQEQELE